MNTANTISLSDIINEDVFYAIEYARDTHTYACENLDRMILKTCEDATGTTAFDRLDIVHSIIISRNLLHQIGRALEDKNIFEAFKNLIGFKPSETEQP